MSNVFFEKTKDLREKIREEVIGSLKKISNEKIRKILLQRVKSSFFLKGIIADYIHQGLGGNLSDKERLNLISGLEIYSSSLVLLDNLLDKHYIRNGETTYLSEFGPEMHALASQYATHMGLFKMLPYLRNFIGFSKYFYQYIDNAITGAIEMDVEHPKNSEESLEYISKVNGFTLGAPLALIATTATRNIFKIMGVFEYGYKSGISFGIYEEIRDLIGEHGRERAYELKKGRIPLLMFFASEKDKKFSPKKYVGRDLPEKEFHYLWNQLKQSKAFEKIDKIVNNNFSFAKKSLEKIMKKEYFEELDLLRKDILDSLYVYMDKRNL